MSNNMILIITIFVLWLSLGIFDKVAAKNGN